MDYKRLFESSWKTFTRHLPALLLSTFVLFVVSIFSFGIMLPVATAGYTQSLLLAFRDKKEPRVSDLFSCMKLFIPLLGFSIVVGIVLMIGFMTLMVPGFIIGCLITFFCLYLLPLMTDTDMNLTDAIRESSRMALQEPPTDQLVVVAIYLGLISLGGSTFCIGALLTQPFATIFILAAYEAKKIRSLPAPDQSNTPPPPPPGE